MGCLSLNRAAAVSSFSATLFLTNDRNNLTPPAAAYLGPSNVCHLQAALAASPIRR